MGNEQRRPRILSRREFLKDTGIIVGGAALASLALSSACDTTAPAAPAQTTGTGEAPTSSTPQATTSTPPTTSETVTSTAPTVTTSTETGGPPITTSSVDWLIPVRNCESYVATDRLYSEDMIWIKQIDSKTVEVGMSDCFVVYTDDVFSCWFEPVGTILKREQDDFGLVQSDKMTFDLLSPVSGKLIEVNQALTKDTTPINEDPYIKGWMARIELSDPAELDNLLSPMYFVYLESPTWDGPIPPKHG